MSSYKPSIYIVVYIGVFFYLIRNVYCDETDPVDDVTSTHELKNIHSFFYMSEEEDVDSPETEITKNDQSITVAQSPVCKEIDERNTQEAIFYKRLITILLSNLAVQKVEDRLIGTLNIEASSSQFEYLQNFVNGEGSIREVDRILDNMIKQSEYSACHYMAEASHYLNLISEQLMHYVLLMKEHWDITVVSFTVIASFMILRRQKWSRGLVVFLMIDAIFVISFFITWWRLIQEAEIKLMAAQAQFAEMPIACQPHKMGLWDKMVASFSSTNDCEKYYETIMTNPRLQVTPAFALTYFLSSVIFQPLAYLGLVISEFIDNATSKLNFMYKFPVIIFLFLSFCVCLILLPFSLIGGSINLGIGPFFKFGMKGRASPDKKEERIDRIYEDTLSKKQLKYKTEEIKQITSGQDDLAGGDTAIGTYHRNKKHKNCNCQNKKEDRNAECEEKGEKNDDC